MHHLIDNLTHFLLGGIGERFHIVRAGQRICGARQARLIANDLLRAQGDQLRLLSRYGVGFIIRAGVHRLRPAQGRGHHLNRHPHDVVEGLFHGQGIAATAGIKPQHARGRILRLVTLLHQPRPQTPSRSEASRLLKQIRSHHTEVPADTRRKLIDREPSFQQQIDVRQGVYKRQGHRFHRCGAGLLHVRARDADGIKLRHFPCAKGHHITGETQSGIDRKQPSATGDVLLERIVLQCVAQLLRRHPLLFAHRHVHGQNRRRSRVNGEVRAHLVQGNIFEEALHIR